MGSDGTASLTLPQVPSDEAAPFYGEFLAARALVYIISGHTAHHVRLLLARYRLPVV